MFWKERQEAQLGGWRIRHESQQWEERKTTQEILRRGNEPALAPDQMGIGTAERSLHDPWSPAVAATGIRVLLVEPGALEEEWAFPEDFTLTAECGEPGGHSGVGGGGRQLGIHVRSREVNSSAAVECF